MNLRAISIAETADYGLLRIIADDSDKATSVLVKGGNIISVTPVTVVSVPDKPAGLFEVLNLLADGNIGIEYMYSLFTHQNEKAYMVFRVVDEDYNKFINLIESHGLQTAKAEELGLK